MSREEQGQNQSEDGTKIEDILKSIRGVIDNHHEMIAQNGSSDDASILNLTNPVKPSEEPGLVSKEAQIKAQSTIKNFAKNLENSEYVDGDKSLDSTVEALMRPLIREWLDNNLPRVVERVVEREIKKLVPKS